MQKNVLNIAHIKVQYISMYENCLESCDLKVLSLKQQKPKKCYDCGATVDCKPTVIGYATVSIQ